MEVEKSRCTFAMPSLTSAEEEMLRLEVKELGDEIRKLKLEKNSNPELVKEKIARMLEKKKLLGITDECSGKFVVKFPKGTRDFGPKATAIRDSVLQQITNCFVVHCAQQLDTPVYELKEVLLGKYGEEGGKLIFDLVEQGGQNFSLRYDLTVPFARYLALNNIKQMKRYHIGKVYRRDQPVMTRGRYREFYQCDFDIAGKYQVSMEPEAECLKIVNEVLSRLGLGDFEIKLNHRALLEGMFAVSGIDTSLFKTVCSSIDKLDKVPWDEVKEELINEKHLHVDAVDKLEEMVRMREKNSSLTNFELLDRFLQHEKLSKNEKVQKAVSDLRQLLMHCTVLGIEEAVAFEPALARGLDYYTGTIFETVYKDFSVGLGEISSNGEKETKTHVGTVAAGGRYDNLVELFSTTKQHVPCVGVSFGVERLFSIMELKAQVEESQIRTTSTCVLVGSAQKNLLDKRLEICRELWDAGIKAEVSYKVNPKMLNQLQYCEEKMIPWVIIIGERELEDGVVKIRNVASREETDIPRTNLVQELRQRINLNSIDNLRPSSLREKILNVISEVYVRHGAETIDTPVFELKGVLSGKYGGNNEQLFVELKDQGGELAAMRYDLTVPFARYLAMNKVQNMKRSHIGKVYRRVKEGNGLIDESLHCDFDVVGQYDSMLPDAECLRIIVEVMKQLGLTNYKIKLSHCSIMEGLIGACGIEGKLVEAVLNCLRYSQHMSWDEVRLKLLNETHIENEKLLKLQQLLQQYESNPEASSGYQMLELLENNSTLSVTNNVKLAVGELKLLLQYCKLLGVDQHIYIDPTLIPWFTYYSGIIFNVVARTDLTVVAGGGRYDNLVSKFLTKKQRFPCVGLSFNAELLEHVLSTREKQNKAPGLSLSRVEVLVAATSKERVEDRQKLLCQLWNRGIKAEMCGPGLSYEDSFKYSKENSIPVLLTLDSGANIKVHDFTSSSEKVVTNESLLVELTKILDIKKSLNI
uniref:histidine--tRNA ligase n=1 Tax=Syphacia muris TaxID=451379 RepID=A0A0N5AEM4_9BILA